MAGNADEDRRHGKEKQKDEDGRGRKQKDVGSTSGGEIKKKGRFLTGSVSAWEGIYPSNVKDVGRFWDDVGWFLKDFGKEKQKDEDGSGGKKKDVASTSNWEIRKKDRFLVFVGSDSDWNAIVKSGLKDEDGSGRKKKDLASTSDWEIRKKDRFLVFVGSDSDWEAIVKSGLVKDFCDDDGSTSRNVRNPRVSDRNLRMPESSSENIAGDPSGSQAHCEYSASGQAPPPTSSSDSDVDETKEV